MSRLSRKGTSTRIREFRKLRGMTLNYLAQLVGTTPQTIQRLETGNMTVSLDWLTKIASAFGTSAAALLVTDATASVPVIGELMGNGNVSPLSDTQTLSMVVAAPNPVAVRVTEPISNFDVDTMLLGNRIEFDPDLLFDERNCLVGFRSGRVVFRRVTINTDGVVLGSFAVRGFSEDAVDEIEWVAPVLMAVVYF